MRSAGRGPGRRKGRGASREKARGRVVDTANRVRQWMIPLSLPSAHAPFTQERGCNQAESPNVSFLVTGVELLLLALTLRAGTVLRDTQRHRTWPRESDVHAAGRCQRSALLRRLTARPLDPARRWRASRRRKTRSLWHSRAAALSPGRLSCPATLLKACQGREPIRRAHGFSLGTRRARVPSVKSMARYASTHASAGPDETGAEAGVSATSVGISCSCAHVPRDSLLGKSTKCAFVALAPCDDS